jgi:hypothetical protein
MGRTLCFVGLRDSMIAARTFWITANVFHMGRCTVLSLSVAPCALSTFYAPSVTLACSKAARNGHLFPAPVYSYFNYIASWHR